MNWSENNLFHCPARQEKCTLRVPPPIALFRIAKEVCAKKRLFRYI